MSLFQFETQVISVGTNYLCPRCGNADPRYVGYRNGEPYCRKCIGFSGASVEAKHKNAKGVYLKLDYELSEEQKNLSAQIVKNFVRGVDTLVYAVCGSGKTEISYAVIRYAMSKGMNVAFALPRRDVVIELHERLQAAFPRNSIVAVYGDHHERLEGDCVILTTHQLFRYPHYFDLIVMDEIDAFPYKGNDVLDGIFKTALRGHCLLMSATPSKEVVKTFSTGAHQMLTLHTRFHKHEIPVPKTIISKGVLKFIFLAKRLRNYQKERKQAFIFVPSVSLSETLFSRLSLVCKGGNYVSSKRVGREQIIRDFKAGKYSYLVTTAVLERGITVANLQVVVYQSDDRIYDAATLIQIAGRAGRKASAPDGDVLFLADHESEAMKHAISEIKYCNTFLQNML